MCGSSPGCRCTTGARPRTAAREAEAAGFDAVMTVELGHDVFAPLAIAALATERVELTPSVAVAFPRSPTVLASQAWDLQANSRGRFVLGLGSQVKGHNERRFGIAWTAPAPRLRDYVRALRAIWRCWETRGKLDFHSEHYTLTLMTPDFSPEPTGLADGAGDDRGGRRGDAARRRPGGGRRAAASAVLAPLSGGGVPAADRWRACSAAAGHRENFDVHGGGFVVTGPDEATVAAGMEAARRRIGFYGSTRTYMPILALHGLAGSGAEAASHVGGRALGRDGRAGVRRRGAHLRRLRHVSPRSPGRSSSATAAWRIRSIWSFPADAPVGLRREVLADIRRIPTLGFARIRTDWLELALPLPRRGGEAAERIVAVLEHLPSPLTIDDRKETRHAGTHGTPISERACANRSARSGSAANASRT